MLFRPEDLSRSTDTSQSQPLKVCRSTSEEPSTSGRPFERTPPNLQRPAADSAYNSQGRWLSKLPASGDSDRYRRPSRLQEDWSSGHLVSSATAVQREVTSSHSTFRASGAGQEHDRYAPLDLRQHSGLGDSPLARLRIKAGGQELSQVIAAPTHLQSTVLPTV